MTINPAKFDLSIVTPSRAAEVMRTARFSNYSSLLTPAQGDYIRALMMSGDHGNVCFADILGAHQRCGFRVAARFIPTRAFVKTDPPLWGILSPRGLVLDTAEEAREVAARYRAQYPTQEFAPARIVAGQIEILPDATA